MAPNQLPTTGPTGKQWARSPANKVTNYLTLSIALVTLIAVAYATSTPLQQQHKQQQHLQQQQQRLVSSSSASQSSLLSPHKPHTPHSVLKRSPSSTFENFEPLYERPRAYSNVAPTQNEDSQNFDETDEEFLRQLKEAASYLDDKLAERQRQQQQLAILNQAPGFGRRLLESIGHTQQQQRPQQQQQLAYGYQEPTYGVLVDPQVSASSSAGRASSASGWPNSNENDNLAEAENDTTEDPEAGETNVVVIAPGHGTSRLISSSPNQVADYRLLTDQLQQDQNQQQQQQSFTDAKYKQLLKSILLDQAQANSLASLSPTENSKRDSRGDGPAAKSIDDSTKTEQQQQQSQQPEEQQQEQQQQPDQGSAAKYTTLLEDEQESSPVPTAASAKPGEPAEVKARELTSAPAYGTLVYDQTAQRPAVRDGSTSTSSSPWVVGSMLKRLYCNVVYYLPFLNQLTNWFLPSCQGNKVDTSAEGTTTRGSQVHVAESKRQQQGISIGIGSNSNEGNGRQQQQSIDNGLHAKANVSVSLLVNHSEEAKENHKEISDHDAKDGMLENNGETNKQQQRVSGDESAANDDDGANQDNQQSQTNDKEGKLLLKQQPQLLKHGLKNVKVTVDRKKTNDDDTEEEEAEKANNNNIKDNHYDDAIDDDHFSGQFVNNGNNGAEPSAAAAQDDSVQHQRQRASKSWDLKRDRAPQSFVIENDNDMDMSQMVPAEEVGHRPRYTTTDNDDADDDENDEAVEHDQLQVASSNNNNGYNMMKHSNLLVPIGSASDVPIRTSSNSIRQPQQPDSLLGKYIYAPTQHYYLNSMIPSAALVGSGGGPNSDVGGPFSHQHRVLSSNGGKHIQPGDTIYGSYGGNMPMKAAYAYQSEHTSIGNKPSDLYFLVMVGAFCVMAMAVVLAAGLFAYRIQQNRKSSQDTDYPTYGVVGPNNMSAKCGGAASFVGGYFTGPPSGSSKSGSAKHLPDLYGTPNGAGGSDSGLNSLDKSSSNKKAASVSSLNEQHTHQSANSRTASSNFMAAASQDAARMYHYQHQKQQMIISDRNSGGRQTSASDLDSEDENDDGSYTVYECPGLASAHEMEIKNPLFNDDQSP